MSNINPTTNGIEIIIAELAQQANAEKVVTLFIPSLNRVYQGDLYTAMADLVVDKQELPSPTFTFAQNQYNLPIEGQDTAVGPMSYLNKRATEKMIKKFFGVVPSN